MTGKLTWDDVAKIGVLLSRKNPELYSHRAFSVNLTAPCRTFRLVRQNEAAGRRTLRRG
jgi:hypothetical protein